MHFLEIQKFTYAGVGENAMAAADARLMKSKGTG